MHFLYQNKKIWDSLFQLYILHLSIFYPLVLSMILLMWMGIEISGTSSHGRFHKNMFVLDFTEVN